MHTQQKHNAKRLNTLAMEHTSYTSTFDVAQQGGKKKEKKKYYANE